MVEHLPYHPLAVSRTEAKEDRLVEPMQGLPPVTSLGLVPVSTLSTYHKTCEMTRSTDPHTIEAQCDNSKEDYPLGILDAS